MLVLKYFTTDLFRKSFSLHDRKAKISTDLFQNNKICTTSRSKICSDDVHALDLFPIFTLFLKYYASQNFEQSSSNFDLIIFSEVEKAMENAVEKVISNMSGKLSKI